MSQSQPGDNQNPEKAEKFSPSDRAEQRASQKAGGEASGGMEDLNKSIAAEVLRKRTTRVSGATKDGFTSADSLLPQEDPNVQIAQGFDIPNPVETYKREIEHRYRGRELETMNKDIPATAWSDAYKAFPELKQIGEKDSVRLMKAIIANELDHYGPADVAQDEIAKTGHGGQLVGNRSLGYPQIEPVGLRNMSKSFSQEVAEHKRDSNPLQRFEKMNDDRLAQELTNPSNAPLFVAAHMARDLHTLNNHKNELSVTVQALGYWYNADVAVAQNDRR